MTADWICRACWKRNRATAERCFKCKAPRAADDTTVQQHRSALENRTKVAAATTEHVPDVYVAVPALVFAIMVWLQKIGAIILVILSLILTIADPVFLLVGGVAASVFWILAAIYRAVVNGMRRRAIWAFAVGVLVAGIPAAGELYTVVAPPPPPPGMDDSATGLLTAIVVTSAIYGLLYLAAALCSLVGLVLAITRRRLQPAAA